MSKSMLGCSQHLVALVALVGWFPTPRSTEVWFWKENLLGGPSCLAEPLHGFPAQSLSVPLKVMEMGC